LSVVIVMRWNGSRVRAADEDAKGRAMSDIAPWLSVRDATEAVEFYRAAFGAVDSDRLEDDAGDVIVARLSIDGADF
jgi:hypothetical protein